MLKSTESATFDVMRALRLVLNHDEVASVTLTLARSVAYHLQNAKRHWLTDMEKSSGKKVTIVPDDNCGPGEFTFQCKNLRGSKVSVDI